MGRSSRRLEKSPRTSDASSLVSQRSERISERTGVEREALDREARVHGRRIDRASARLAAGALALAATLGAGCYDVHAATCDEPEIARAVRAEDVTIATRVEGVTRSHSVASEGDAPALAWDGASWALAFGDRSLLLDAHGVARTEISSTGLRASGIAASGCAHAVAGDSSAGRSAVAVLSASSGVARAGAIVPGVDADVSATPRGWLVVSAIRSVGARMARLSIRELDAELASTSMALELSVPELRSPRVVTRGGAATAVWIEEDGIAQATIDLSSRRTGRRRPVMTANVWGAGTLEAVALDAERMVVAASDGAAVHLAITSMITSDVLAGPIAVSRTTASEARPSVAVMPEHAAIAVCHPAGPGPWGGPDVQDTVVVQLVSEQGMPLGDRVEVTRTESVRAVACGWNGRELLVVWWAEGAGIGARRLRPSTPSVPI